MMIMVPDPPRPQTLRSEPNSMNNELSTLERDLVDEKQPSPLGPPQGHRHRPTVGSCGGVVFYEGGTPVKPKTDTSNQNGKQITIVDDANIHQL